MKTQTVHIVFGFSATGCLRCCLKTNQLEQDIHPITDDLSFAPLHSREDRVSFGAALVNAISPNDQELLHYLTTAVDSWMDLSALQNSKVIIWHCKNAPEQLALQMAVSKLAHIDELYEVAIDNDAHRARSTAEFSPEKLTPFLGTENKISPERRQELAAKWDISFADNGMLRIWQNEQIRTVDETYYDGLLISACTGSFANAARIVGLVLGTSRQLVSDTWINYRLIKLILAGTLEARGDLTRLRSFEVSRAE